MKETGSDRNYYTLRPNDPRDDSFPAEIKDDLFKILIFNTKNRKKGFPDISVHHTDGTNDLANEEILNRMENTIENMALEINMLNPLIKMKISNIESQIQEFQKKIDLLIALHQRGILSSQTATFV